MKIKIIGIGSPFGDDCIGWEVIKTLKKDIAFNSKYAGRVEVACADRPGLRLLELINGADFVILIDAVKSHEYLGKVIRLSGEELTRFQHCLSSHGFGLMDAIKLGEVLGMMNAKIIFFGVEVENVTGLGALSSELIAVLEPVCEKVKKEIRCIVST